MAIHCSHPAALVMWALLALPWLRGVSPSRGYSWVLLLPSDRASRVLERGLQILTTIAIGACVLGLAGPFRVAPPVEQVGRGAEIELLLDRSRSMDEPFAGRVGAGTVMTQRSSSGYESKGSAARRQLAEFARQRQHDLIGMLAFTTIPIRIIGFTPQADLVQAAIRAGNEGRGLAQTDVGLALLAAVAQFAGQPYNGSRVILLVSDGGARLDVDIKQRIADAMRRERIALYWLYLRTNRSPGLLADREVAAEDQDQVPEHFLNEFFASMGTPYHAYEAEDPNALKRAVDDIDRLEQLPIRYVTTPDRRDLTEAAYGIAFGAAVLLLLAGLIESRRWT